MGGVKKLTHPAVGVQQVVSTLLLHVPMMRGSLPGLVLECSTLTTLPSLSRQ